MSGTGWFYLHTRSWSHRGGPGPWRPGSCGGGQSNLCTPATEEQLYYAPFTLVPSLHPWLRQLPFQLSCCHFNNAGRALDPAVGKSSSSQLECYDPICITKCTLRGPRPSRDAHQRGRSAAARAATCARVERRATLGAANAAVETREERAEAIGLGRRRCGECALPQNAILFWGEGPGHADPLRIGGICFCAKISWKGHSPQHPLPQTSSSTMQALCAANAFAPATRRSTSRRATVSVKAARTLWLPAATAPAHLDGSLPGDSGFDPLGLGEACSDGNEVGGPGGATECQPAGLAGVDKGRLAWYTEAEKMNGRWVRLLSFAASSSEYLSTLLV